MLKWFLLTSTVCSGVCPGVCSAVCPGVCSGVCPGVCSGVCDGDPWSCIPICVFFHKDSTTIVAQRGVRLFVEYSETVIEYL